MFYCQAVLDISSSIAANSYCLLESLDLALLQNRILSRILLTHTLLRSMSTTSTISTFAYFNERSLLELLSVEIGAWLNETTNQILSLGISNTQTYQR